MATIIKVENLSKVYRLGEIGTGSISQDVERWIKTRVFGKEDPFSKIGESDDMQARGGADFVHSLKDVNFEIEQGDTVGIIGRNGAGKSTLLKLLSRITSPTTGTIKMNGRVASLLEVGTGFHGDLTGRENIYMNGSILGMRKFEIDKMLDEIIDFSGVERYIDTPVKKYSSGMYVRLAFAVAAHVQTEILIVDEVLAVGDAEFQKKCLGKMGDISRGEGKTVLFVSHSTNAMMSLCKSGILLKDGRVVSQGNIKNVIDNYVGLIKNGDSYYEEDNLSKKIQVLSAESRNNAGEITTNFTYDQDIILVLRIKNYSVEKGIRYNISLKDVHGSLLMIDSYYLKEEDFDNKFYSIKIPGNLLSPTRFIVGISIDIPHVKLFFYISDLISFNIVDTGSSVGKMGDSDIGLFLPKFVWQ